MKTILVLVFVLFAFRVSAWEPMNFSQLDIRAQKLAACESGFRPVVIVDSNGLKSYNWFQFQLATFISFGKDSGILPDITEKEARILIHNPWVQSAIVEWALDNGLAHHWWNCARVTGLL